MCHFATLYVTLQSSVIFHIPLCWSVPLFISFHFPLHHPHFSMHHSAPFTPSTVSLWTLLQPSTLLSVSFSMPPWPFVPLHTPMHALYYSCLSLPSSTPLCTPLSFAHHSPCLSIHPCILLCSSLCNTTPSLFVPLCTHLCNLHPSLNSSIPVSIPLLPISVSLCISLYLSLCCCAPLHTPLCIVLWPLHAPPHTVSTPSVTYVQPLHFSMHLYTSLYATQCTSSIPLYSMCTYMHPSPYPFEFSMPLGTPLHILAAFG